MKKTSLTLCCAILLLSLRSLPCLGQQASTPVKREFRAVWISSIANLDYPKKPTAERVALREEYKNLLDEYQKMGFNAVIVQIRPAADALYPSKQAPWSKYLTGTQGRAPYPEFDPLQFMVEETHLRGMEFHAWLNPYRATADLDTVSLAPTHAFRLHRDWMLRYGKRFYFNPAIPEVRQHISDVVAEVVDNYDVDAIHFDDYFYPYPEKGAVLSDSADYRFFGLGFSTIEDWRRSNIDALIEMVSQRIKASKPHVKFGVSPFGVWRNKSKDPQFGSDTRAGVTCYDDLYADVLNWIRKGWIDYVIPQIYWNIGYSPADHTTLLNWWSTMVQDCHLYIGHAAYKVGNNSEPAWNDPAEIPRQIRLNRRTAKCLGSAYFRSQSILLNPLSLADSLTACYTSKALVPELLSLEQPLPDVPRLKIIWPKQGKVNLRWKAGPRDKTQPPRYFVVYRFDGDTPGNFEDPRNILTVTAMGAQPRQFKFVDQTAQAGLFYTYAVTAVNRQHSESKPSKPRAILKKEKGLRWARLGTPREGGGEGERVRGRDF